MTVQNPRNLPHEPVAMYLTKGPGSFQYLKPIRGVPGTPPRSIINPKIIRKIMKRILRSENQNSTSP